MPFQKKLEVIGFKNESTPGVAETLASADANVRVSNITYSPDHQSDETSREVANGEYGRENTVMGSNLAQISFSVKLTYGGTDATSPNYAKMLASCGLKPKIYTTTGIGFEPLKEYSCKTSTIYYETQAACDTKTKRIILRGCTGSAVLTCAGVGKATYINFNFFGIISSESDVDNGSELVSTGLSTVVSESFKNANCTVLGVSGAKISTFSLDFGNTVEAVIDQGDAEGVAYYNITDRQPKLMLNPYQMLTSTNDIISKMKAGTEGESKIVYGSSSPHFSIIVPVSQAVELGDSVREGNTAWDIGLVCERNGTVNTDITPEATFTILQGAFA